MPPPWHGSRCGDPAVAIFLPSLEPTAAGGIVFADAFNRGWAVECGPRRNLKGNAMKKLVAIASAAVLGLGVAACDSGAENAAEEQAEVVGDAQEEAIDTAEDAGQITDEQADAALEASEVQEDTAEDAADTMDAAPE